MGENLAAGDRTAVRSPMQWDSSVNGGFSRAPTELLSAPPVPGDYRAERINVVDQLNDSDSLLSFVQRLTRCYRTCPELGWGEAGVLDSGHAEVLALRTSWDDGSLLTVHNLGPQTLPVSLELSDRPADAVLIDLLGPGRTSPLDPSGRVGLTIEGYGYRWLRISSADSRRLA